jgi:hypothetical protein
MLAPGCCMARFLGALRVRSPRPTWGNAWSMQTIPLRAFEGNRTNCDRPAVPPSARGYTGRGHKAGVNPQSTAFLQNQARALLALTLATMGLEAARRRRRCNRIYGTRSRDESAPLLVPPRRQRPLQLLQHQRPVRPSRNDRLNGVRRQQRRAENPAQHGHQRVASKARALSAAARRQTSVLSPTGWHSSGNRDAVPVRRRSVGRWAPASPPSAPGGSSPWRLVSPAASLRQGCRRSRCLCGRDSRGPRAGSARWAHRVGSPACGNCRGCPDGGGPRGDLAPRPEAGGLVHTGGSAVDQHGAETGVVHISAPHTNPLNSR